MTQRWRSNLLIKMRNLLHTLWVRMFVFAAIRLGYSLIIPKDDDTVIHIATSEAALLTSMRLYIEEYEAEASSRKKEALKS